MRVATLFLMCVGLSAPAYASTIIFTDGPVNGATNAFFIDGPGAGPFTQTVSDQFIATNSGTADSLDFGEWVPTGTTPTSVSWSFGTTAFGSNISSGSTALVSSTFFGVTGFGFDVYTVHVSGLSGNFVAGNTYFLTLGGANNSNGDQFAAWDVNEGPAVCSFARNGVSQGGCGDGGESFTINTADVANPVPEPGTITMLLGGLVGLTGVVRRKLSV